jgi:hypothetical protein
MPTIELSEQQVLDLVMQLPPARKLEALLALAKERSTGANERMTRTENEFRRLATERNKDWDQMSEGERESFIDDLIHEDRKCT